MNYVSLSDYVKQIVNYLDQSNAIGTGNNIEEFMMRHNTHKFLIGNLSDCKKVRFWVVAY